MSRYFFLVLVSILMYSSGVAARESFSVYDITLGTDFTEAVDHLQSLCQLGACPAESSVLTGITSVKVYQKFSLIHFSNTKRTQVDLAKPFQAVSISRGADNRVMSITAEAYGDPITVRTFYQSMADAYTGRLQDFTDVNPNTNIQITIKSDLNTDRSINFYTPNLSGTKFQVAQWKLANGALTARATYTDYDALARVEATQPAEFDKIRKQLKLSTGHDDTAMLTPRTGTQQELKRAKTYPSVETLEQTQLVDDGVSVKVVGEKTDEPDAHPSEIVVNGVVVSKAGLFTDGVTYQSVQKLGYVKGLYWVHAGWDGNGCSSQMELLLTIRDGSSHLSEPFGRCNTVVTTDKNSYYFTYDGDEYEPPATFVIN